MRLIEGEEILPGEADENEIVIETNLGGVPTRWYIQPIEADEGEVGLKLSLDGETVVIRAASSNCVFLSYDAP